MSCPLLAAPLLAAQMRADQLRAAQLLAAQLFAAQLLADELLATQLLAAPGDVARAPRFSRSFRSTPPLDRGGGVYALCIAECFHDIALEALCTGVYMWCGRNI